MINLQREKKTLLVYKRSAYEIYFLKRDSSFQRQRDHIKASDIRPFKLSHFEHYKTLAYIEKILRAQKIPYQKYSRSRKIDYSPYEFIISVGGDGTFLEAARSLTNQAILGVNSDTVRSVGRFCAADRNNFAKILDRYFQGEAPIKELTRLRLKMRDQNRAVNITNDLLICHSNPAAMSRYLIEVNGVKEKHYSSGIWISTAAGSSGAIKSAGGKILPMDSHLMQFLSRELYEKKGKQYQLKHGVLKINKPVKVTSLMRNGSVYADGCHVRFPFHFGEVAEITPAKDPLRIVHP